MRPMLPSVRILALCLLCKYWSHGGSCKITPTGFATSPNTCARDNKTANQRGLGENRVKLWSDVETAQHPGFSVMQRTEERINQPYTSSPWYSHTMRLSGTLYLCTPHHQHSNNRVTGLDDREVKQKGEKGTAYPPYMTFDC